MTLALEWIDRALYYRKKKTTRSWSPSEESRLIGFTQLYPCQFLDNNKGGALHTRDGEIRQRYPAISAPGSSNFGFELTLASVRARLGAAIIPHRE